MTELKPCLHCGKQVAALETCHELEDCANFESCGDAGYYSVVCGVNNGGCGESGRYGRTEEDAIAAWNRGAPARKLTIDELREMDGQPAWVVDEISRNAHWCLVSLKFNLYNVVRDEDILLGSDGNFYLLQEYGDDFTAYDRPPGGDR